MTDEPVLVLPGSAGEPYPALTALIQRFGSDGNPPDWLMFGDSVVERVSRHDADRRSLADILRERVDVLALSRSAHHPGVYSRLVRALSRLPGRPRRGLIVPVNLRCFSPQWHLNPDWQLAQETAALDAFAESGAPPPPIRDEFRDPRRHAAFEELRVEYPLSELSTIGEFRELVRSVPGDAIAESRRRRQIFIFHYTHPLAADHPRLRSLVDTLRLAAAIGIDCFPYVTPINVEAGQRLVGRGFAEALRENVATVTEALSEVAALRDWSTALPETAFFHEDTATEHLNETGRLELSRMILEAIAAVRPREGNATCRR